MRRAARRSAGFSLLELILALGMVAMLSLALYMSLTIAMKARESAVAAVAPVKTAVLAADLVRQDLESVLPPTGLLAGKFVGTPQAGADVLDFYCIGNDAGWATAPAAVQGRNVVQTESVPWSEGPRYVELALRTDVNPPMLVRRVTRNLLAQTQTDPEEEILCRNVKSFTLRYYDGSAWQDQWDSTTMGDVLPTAVEMTLEMLIDSKPGQPQTVYKVLRVFPLACAKPASDTTGTGGAQ